jgi:hypothetical protein
VEVGDGVIDIDAPADSGGVGEHIGWVAQQNLLSQAGEDFVAVNWEMPGGRINHGPQIDPAVVTQESVKPA